MKMNYTLGILLVLVVLLCGVKARAESISSDEAKRLEVFFKKTLGTKMPNDANVSVTGYAESPIKGFKKGSFVVEASGKSGNIPFLISQDGRYIILAESVDTKAFTDAGVGGLKKGAIPLGRQQIPILISGDGRYLLLGELIDSKANTTSN